MATANAKYMATGVPVTSSFIASPQVLVTYTPKSSNCVINVRATIVARDTTNNNSSSFLATRSFAKVAGTLSAIGGANTVISSEIEAGSYATLGTIQTSGGNIVVASSQSQNGTIIWGASFDIEELQFA